VSKRSLFQLKALLLLGAIWLLIGGLSLSSAGVNPKLGPARSEGLESGALADPEASVWGASVNVSNTEGESRAPALAADDSGVVHVVWEEDARYLLHSYWRNGVWSTPSRVATGEQPAMAIDQNGVVHLVFMNEFRGNYEIYYLNGK